MAGFFDPEAVKEWTKKDWAWKPLSSYVRIGVDQKGKTITSFSRSYAQKKLDAWAEKMGLAEVQQ
jgi:hypothetical protein